MTEASRRIVSTLSMLANRSPAVTTPTTQSTTRTATRPRLRPASRCPAPAQGADQPVRPGPPPAPRGSAPQRRAGPSPPAGRRSFIALPLPVPALHDQVEHPYRRARPAGPFARPAPSATTSTRSDSPRTSGISLDTTTTATPASPAADQGVDLAAGPDVDAAGGLVEEQHVAVRAAAIGPARPSAGCRRRACAPAASSRAGDVERRVTSPAAARSAPPVEEAAAGEPARASER